MHAFWQLLIAHSWVIYMSGKLNFSKCNIFLVRIFEE